MNFEKTQLFEQSRFSIKDFLEIKQKIITDKKNNIYEAEMIKYKKNRVNILAPIILGGSLLLSLQFFKSGTIINPSELMPLSDLKINKLIIKKGGKHNNSISYYLKSEKYPEIKFELAVRNKLLFESNRLKQSINTILNII